MIVVILSGLLFHGLFVSHHTRKLMFSTMDRVINPVMVAPVAFPQSKPSMPVPIGIPQFISLRPEYPDLFIYRRTKKTGSSSMLDAIITELKPLGYIGLYNNIATRARAEYTGHSPRRLLLAEHNQITKSIHPQRSAVIADTVRDGYNQMTSYCRYVKKVRSCTGDDMLQCLNSKDALWQNEYRWAGHGAEDEDTYIDLPLSTEHPSLSTTIFRKVFPNATLDVKMFNVKRSACAENETIRKLYRQKYRKLEWQIAMLRKRMLILAGYPVTADDGQGPISIEDMLDEADKRERKKYSISTSVKAEDSYSMEHKELINTIHRWTRMEDGSLKIVKSRPQKMN